MKTGSYQLQANQILVRSLMTLNTKRHADKEDVSFLFLHNIDRERTNSMQTFNHMSIFAVSEFKNLPMK